MTLDVSKAIEPKSDQQNSDDYLSGPKTVKIIGVDIKSTSEQPVWIHLEGKEGKPWKPSKTALRCLAMIWGADASKWSGLSLTLYNDPEVTWGGMKVGGIRVSHMEGLTEPRTLMLTRTRGKKGATVIKPLVVDKSGGAVKTAIIDTKTLFQDARDNAELGREGFGKWWKSKTKPERDAMGEIMDELKAITQKADSGNN